ncbi:DUF4240 domain-containing protein [Streptacidiphilus sp. P02-A3a]|uniref:DUF4240 domain-containing protein n=1 Tax=Streptacidiphilus sp. P02-A3a TaxID=2704468 RepID=UPI0015F8E678|nr:DUF4240 domain-containing protein [Streptacidiphilus sp. P02-A3a]QMU68481.1 DUF4240 domain-containing protein [Streptacidiphilus sp. P02-A3a]
MTDETEFWQLIDETREAAQGDPVDQAELLVERLLGLTPDDVIDFARLFEARLARAWRLDLWGAADLLLGGAGDESFDYFCCWLIGQGRDVFEGALADPDTLADLVPDFDEEVDGDAEELGDAADRAHEQLTGMPLPELGLPVRPAEPVEPSGGGFDFDDARVMEERFPRLWQRYGG